MEKTQSEIDILGYITKLEENFTGKEISFIKAAYFITKDNYEENQHFDIIQASCETIITNREISGRALFEKILTNIYKTVGRNEKSAMPYSEISKDYPAAPCMEEDRLDSTKCLRELLALFDMDSMDKVKDEIFLKVLSGIPVSKIAAMYHTTCGNISRIYNEKLGVINGIRVVNGKVYVDEEENYSKRLEEELSDIREKIFY